MLKTMNLGKVRNGEKFLLDGVEFIKLGDESVGLSFVLTVDTLPDTCAFECPPFTRKDNNNFVGSNVQRVVDEWLRGHRDIHMAVIERHIDLTSVDGMTDYGTPYVYGRILTVDEYNKYQQFIPPTPKSYWIATPFHTRRSQYSRVYDASFAYYVGGSDGLYTRSVGGANVCYPRPALYLEDSTSVSIKVNPPEEALRNYTNSELLGELLRRHEGM